MYLFTVFITLFMTTMCVLSQRVAPGVPPQHYQQAQAQYQQPQQHVPMQQQQHVPVQPQVPIQQQQQVPVQHQQMPVQHQQVPVQHQQGHHHGPPQPGQLLNTQNIAQEKEHIQEHMEVPIDTSKMSEQELQFHYFKMHDADNNNMLDGNELIKSLIHWHGPSGKEKTAVISDERIVDIVGPLLEKYDLNNDGYIEYSEYVLEKSKEN